MSRDLKQPIRILEFHHSVTLRWKYFYGIGSWWATCEHLKQTLSIKSPLPILNMPFYFYLRYDGSFIFLPPKAYLREKRAALSFVSFSTKESIFSLTRVAITAAKCHSGKCRRDFISNPTSDSNYQRWSKIYRRKKD